MIVSTRGGRPNLFWTAADGSSQVERLTTSEHYQGAPSFSPDGRFLAFHEGHPTSKDDIWILPLEGDRRPEPFLRTPFGEMQPRFSPDGRWLAYASNESGRVEVYVTAYPGPGGKVQVSTEGGYDPRWAPNGRDLFYRRGEKMMAVAMTTGPTFRAERTRLLFEVRYFSWSWTGYDISSDGQRFLMVQESEQQTEPTQINVVLNWSEELKRRVPSPRK